MLCSCRDLELLPNRLRLAVELRVLEHADRIDDVCYLPSLQGFRVGGELCSKRLHF